MQHEIAASFMIEHGLEPLERYPGAGKQWRCRCLTCGDEVRLRYTNIKQGWGGCGRCGRRAQGRTQRGPEAEAISDFRAVGLEPIEPFVNVMTPWRSQCRNCGREVSPLLNNIRKGQGACRWCSGKSVDAEDAIAVMRAASLEPLVAYPGRHAPWQCRCLRCGQIVSPRYGAVKKGGGCRYCNDTAIKPDAGPVVLLLSPALDVRAQTPQTQQYLRLLIPPDAAAQAPVPAGAYNVSAQLLAREAGVDGNPPLARVHLGSGHWLTLRAARMDSAQPVPERDIAVSIETTAPGGRVSLFARACGLSSREAELLGHVLTGAGTRDIARLMFLSEHTVQDHLKSIFAKTATRTRRTLLASVLWTQPPTGLPARDAQ
jgi:DNA-binding CsgD family transcriptional regulator